LRAKLASTAHVHNVQAIVLDLYATSGIDILHMDIHLVGFPCNFLPTVHMYRTIVCTNSISSCMPTVRHGRAAAPGFAPLHAGELGRRHVTRVASSSNQLSPVTTFSPLLDEKIYILKRR
jgi:hypothetical protein